MWYRKNPFLFHTNEKSTYDHQKLYIETFFYKMPFKKNTLKLLFCNGTLAICLFDEIESTLEAKGENFFFTYTQTYFHLPVLGLAKGPSKWKVVSFL